MANEKNLVNLATRPQQERQEIARMGQKASTEAKNYKKEQIKNLKMLLDTLTDDGKTTYREAMNLGVLKGALNGKAENFKTIMDYLDDNQSNNSTPIVNINIIEDNKELEQAFWSDNDETNKLDQPITKE